MRYFSDFITFIPTESLIFLFAGFLLLLIVSFYFLKSTKSHLSYFKWFFLVGFLLFGIGFSLIDPFLNEWDEQYHALVAKHLSENPFKPILIKNSPVALDYKSWAYCHVWMHKQPLFMWQMALSIKTFGTSLFAVRLPSVLLHALTAILLLSIAGRFLIKSLALLACLLFGLSGYFNDYTSGAIGMDHNDVAFVFYITLSFWCWLKYRENREQKKWQLFIGMAVGGAILCKWLVGLLVFSGWGLVLLMENYKNWQEWKHLLRSFAVASIIVVPWQIYCYIQFNREYVYEMNYNNKHLFHAIEAHKHDHLFYWQTMKQAFGGGEIIRWLILLGIILFFITAIRTKEKWKLFFPLVFLIAFVFFTVAETKLQGYMTIIGPLGFIFLLYPVNQLILNTRLSKWKMPVFVTTLILVPVIYFQFGFKQVLDQHKFGSIEVRKERLLQTEKALNFIDKNPLNEPGGYYLMKDHSTNILCSVLFFTDKNVLHYSDTLVKQLNQKGISHCVIQY